MDPQGVEQINTLLDSDAELREKIKEHVNDFDKKARLMVGTLNKIIQPLRPKVCHTIASNELCLISSASAPVPALLDTVRPILHSYQETAGALVGIIPENQFWRWKDMWSNSLRSAVFSAVLVEYLANGTLLSLPSVGAQLGIKDEWKDRFTLTVEDYLHGLITMVNELSRLAVNSVTLGDFEAPIRISLFVKDLFAGFSMLNLKNDILRRRFDSLKYDIKKIEEVVYDVSLRNLSPASSKEPSKPVA